MDYAMFESILDQLESRTMAIHLYNWGEPLLLSDFPHYCSLAKKSGFVVSASTNLNILMDENKARELVESGLDRLIISLDGLSEETYSLYRKGGEFQKVIQNINLLVNAKKLLGKKYPLLYFQLVRHKGNDSDVPLFGRACRRLGADYYSIIDILLPFGEQANPILVNNWIPQDRLTDQATVFDIPENEIGRACFHLWKLPVINCDGTVAPCCYVYRQKDDMGDLNTKSFVDVWNSMEYQNGRNLFKSKDGPAIESCWHCSVYREYRCE